MQFRAARRLPGIALIKTKFRCDCQSAAEAIQNRFLSGHSEQSRNTNGTFENRKHRSAPSGSIRTNGGLYGRPLPPPDGAARRRLYGQRNGVQQKPLFWKDRTQISRHIFSFMSTKRARTFIRLRSRIDDGDFAFRAPIHFNRNIFHRFTAANRTDFIICFYITVFTPHCCILSFRYLLH